MKKKIARRFAMLLAFIVLTTTFASDYNSIGAKASDEAGVESQIQDETADVTDETIEDAAPAEEDQPEQDEDAAPAEETAPAEAAQAEDAAQVEENEQTEDAAPAEGEQNEEAAPDEEPAPAEAAQAAEDEQNEDAAQAEEQDEAAPAEETAPADETAQSEDAAQADDAEDDQNQPAADDASADDADQSADTQDDANADAADNSADGTAQSGDETAKADADTVDADAAEDADEEQEIITITYKATEGGSVSVESEEVTDKAEGSTAEADEGYEFVNWTYDEKVVSEKTEFIPKGDLLVDGAEFTANFAEVEEKAFAAETVVDNIRITLYANPGVLPEDAELRVEKVSPALEAQIEEKIDEVTGEDVEVKKTISFDINIYSPSLGAFVQPEDGTVEVRFSQIEEAKGAETELSVYHVEDDLSNVTDMNAVTGDTEAKIDAEHFSTYTLSLTIKAKNKEDESLKVRVIAVNEKGENLFGTGNGNGKEFVVNLEKGKEVPVAEFEKTLGIRSEDSDFENYEFLKAYKNNSYQDKHEIVSFFVKGKNNEDALYYKLKNNKEESNSSAVIFVYSEKKQEEMADIIVLATYEGSYTDAKGEKLKKLLNLDTVKAYAPLGVISLPKKALEGYGNNIKFSNNANSELYGKIVSAFDDFKCGTDVISTNNKNTIVANLSKVAKNNDKTELCYFENGNQYKEDDFVGDYKTCHYHLNLCFDDSAFVNDGEELVYYYLLEPGLELPADSKSYKTYYPAGQGHDFSGTAVSHDKIADADKDEYGNVWDPTGKKVKTYLKSSPDAAILTAYLEKYKDKYPLSAENYEIVWYTYKVTNSDTFWHVDGFVREKEKVEYVDVAVYAIAPDNTKLSCDLLVKMLGLDADTVNTSYGSAPVGVTRLPKSMFPTNDKGERYYSSITTDEEKAALEEALSGINTGSDVLNKNIDNNIVDNLDKVIWSNKRSALKYFNNKKNTTFVSVDHQTCKYHLDLCLDVKSIRTNNSVTLSVRKFGYERPTFADGSVDGTGQKLVKYLSFSRDKGEYNGTTGFGCGYGTADFLEDKDGFKVVEYTKDGKDHSYVGGEGVEKAYNLTVDKTVQDNITAALAEYSKEHPEYAGYTYDDIRWYVYKHANEPDSRYEWHFDGELVPHEEMATVAIYATPGKDSLYEDEFVETLGLDKDDHFVDSNWYSPIGEVSLPKSVCEAGLTDENLNDVLDAVLENGVNTSDKVLKKNIENGIENFLKNNRDKIVKPSTSGKTKLFANTGKSGFTKECKFDYHLDLYVYFLGSDYISFYILKDKNAEGNKIEIPLPQSLGGPHGCPNTDYAPGSTEWKGTVEKKLSELVTDEAKDNYYAPYDENTGEYISGAGHTTNVLENVDQFDKAAQPGMNAYLKSTYEPKYGGEQLTADDVVWYVFKKVGNNNYHIDGYPTASVTYHSNYPEELEKDEETSVIEQRVGFDHWTLGDEGSFVAEGYVFNGYFLDEECTQPAQECFESVHERMHLYANWVKKPKLVAILKENGYKEIRKTYDGKEHEAEIDLDLKLYNAENLQLDNPPAEDTPEIIGALTNLFEKFAGITSINASADDGATPITQEVKDDKGNVYVVTGLKVKGGKGTEVKLDADGNVTSYDAVLVYVPEDISIKLGDMELNDQIDFEIQGLEEGKDLVVGKLFIDPRNVELSSPSAEKVYDKTPLTAPDITVSGDGFADGEGATYDVTGSQTDVGESKNEFTYTLYDGTNGTKETKATNYVINKTEGILKVTPVTEEKKDEDPGKDPEKPSENPSDKPSNSPSDSKSDETTTENGNSEQGKTSESEKEEEKEEKEKKDDKKKKEDKKSESNNSGEESSSDSAQGSPSEQRTPGVEAPRGQVLGAVRGKVAPETEKAGVLGARRGGTEDETNTARIFILLVAAGAAATFIALGKKKNKEEDE